MSLQELSLLAEQELYRRKPLELIYNGKLSIRTKTGEIKKFIPNFAQKIILDKIEQRIREDKPVRIRLLKARQLGFCVSPETRVLSSDLRWISANDIQAGQSIVATDENVPGGKGIGRRLRLGIVEAKREVFEPAFKIEMDNGETLVATGPHKFLMRKHSGTDMVWRTISDASIGDEIRLITKPWGRPTLEDSWFSGLADSEGSLAKKCSSGCELNVSQVAGPVLNRLRAYATNNGFNFREEWDRRKGGESSKLGNKPVCKIVFSRIDELFRIFGKSRPTRFISRDWWEGKELPGKRVGNACAKILSITPIAKMRMIDIQTSTKTFIAEGFVSHNSTLFEAIIYCFTSRRQGFHSLVIAHDEDGSKGLFEMNKLFHETLEQQLKPSLKKSNEIALEFDGLKSRIDIDTSRNKSAGRSHTYQMVHKSESAFFAFPKDVNLGIANTVPDLPGTMIFDETTANGMNYYYDEVNKSLQCIDGFDFIFIPWVMNPEYRMYAPSDLELTKEELDVIKISKDMHNIDVTKEQISWRRYAIEHKCGGDVDLFHQEYPLTVEEAFIFSGRPRFDIHILRKLKNQARKPIRKDGFLDIYNELDQLAHYVMGVDTSEGKINGDKSSVCILNCKTFSIDAEYNGLIEPDILAGHVAAWGETYNNALAVVEINNHGLALLNELKKIYHNIYHRKSFDRSANEWKEQIGWQTNLKSKPLLITNLAKALRDGLDIFSHGIVDELMTFIFNDNGTMSAAEGKNDDRVISTALAVQGYLESDKTIPKPKEKADPYSLEYYEQQAEHAQMLRELHKKGR